MTAKRTTSDLKRILELAERATPGPWVAINGHPSGAMDTTRVEAANGITVAYTVLDGIGDEESDYHNAAYIAAANPKLVADLIRLALAAHNWQKARAVFRDAVHAEVADIDTALAAVFGEGGDNE